MREKSVCRRCVEASLLTSNRGAASRRTFLIAGSKPHYAPDLPFKLEHVRLDLEVDPKARVLRGVVTQKVRAVAPGQRHLRLDQIGLTIEAVTVAGQTVQFSVEGHSLRIELPSPTAPGDELEFSVRYAVSNPVRGIYFTGPDSDYPDRSYQVWTQGQDEDSRYWFPSFDYPNQKATSEVIATVPLGFTAISNGALLSRQDIDGKTRFHYKLGSPHVSYLITLAVGEFVEWADKGPLGIPVQYFVAQGRVEDGKRSFGATPTMIDAFEKRIGVPYPYEKYSQVAVQDFIFGGMENTSATTQTDLTLHDARAHLDFSSDPLVSHELAHQWFGDLLTCRDWSHGWLNEGFATFMERVWVESNPGPGGGFEEAKYYSYMDFQEHLEEDGKKYRRPIVCNSYLEPIDLFDTHLYHKGGLVLNLIRHLLGEDLFWKSIKRYVERHRGMNVETLDLIRAIEEVTGRNLRRFFDEWVFGAGYPDFELSYSWHEDRKLAELVIEQKQTGGLPALTEHGATTHLFHLPVVVEFTLGNGEKISRTIEIGESRERIFFEAPSKPVMVRFDPDNWIPKTMKFPRSKELLLYQLSHDTDCMGRIEAVRELAKIADAQITEAIGSATLSDSFWGVQVEAADALASIRSDTARNALIGALKAAHPKARRAVVKALGSFKDDKAAQALLPFAEKDESYYVEAEAIFAWASARCRAVPPPESSHIEVSEAFLLEQLAKPSYREVIRAAALKGLAELPGINRGERPRALSALIEWTRRGQPLDARVAAVSAVGAIARTSIPSERARIMAVLAQLAAEPNYRLRMALVAALTNSEAFEAIPILEHVCVVDSDGRVKRGAREAASALATSGALPESVVNLKAEMEKFEERYRILRTIVEEYPRVRS